ncbi:toxin YhaV [Rhizobium rosettiformans]|jgi:toxin YhaV|uniref:Type II toxin-antitoxin system YhaV family toxin n=2 Tax=Rhizobium rosettiformans TaxID=1368430 RepID=A0A4S8QAU8_9HYPH|nr:type II toxin-antitoxin system YhaV family toxin [Rhizobium rosettiformans]MBB5274226.1 toxin YhaV [Rhizobium rosettiformans]THV38129.1 type II toxin-antitoxin system YhaV family toxin [Rhizobium rosettiformans W3]
METVNGWIIRTHPLFLDQLERLTAAVEREARKKPGTFRSGANFKLLSALNKLVFEVIPADPTLAMFRQGGTLGAERKHWFRAKFGNGRFRLFFRYNSAAKVIVFAWVNDAETLRSYGSRSDAYAVFRGMLEDGNPPDSWKELLDAASSDVATRRLEALTEASAKLDKNNP